MNMNKQTDPKRYHNFILFYLKYGGPCHLSSFFKQCSGTLFSTEISLLIHLWKKETFLSLHYYLINIVNIEMSVNSSIHHLYIFYVLNPLQGRGGAGAYPS